MNKTTRFITIEVTLRDSIPALEEAIKTTLQIYGRPLNWIVIDVNPQQQTAIIDALVTDWDVDR